MSKADSHQGSLDLLVLKILSRRLGLHGYAIMTAIQALTENVLRAEEGSLYPPLHRMEEAGCIPAHWVTKASGRRTRLYDLTGAGRKQLAAEDRDWGHRRIQGAFANLGHEVSRGTIANILKQRGLEPAPAPLWNQHLNCRNSAPL